MRSRPATARTRRPCPSTRRSTSSATKSKTASATKSCYASSSSPKSGSVSFRAELHVDIRGRARRLVKPGTVRALRRRLVRAMQAAGVAERALTLSLSDDAELLALNREYANENHATDVLSFEQEAPLLGDVI